MLEDLHHRDAAYVFGTGFVHAHKRAHVAFHELHALAAHHGHKTADRDRNRDQARKAKTPIEGEQQREHADHHGDRARRIGQHVREQRFGAGGAAVDHAAQLSGGVAVEKAERQAHEVLGGLLAHVRCRAERRQMRAHEREEVGRDRSDCAADSPPAVRGDPLRSLPIRCDFDEIARDKPDAHVGHEAEQLRYSADRQADVRERFSAACEVEELGDVVTFGGGCCRRVGGSVGGYRVDCRGRVAGGVARCCGGGLSGCLYAGGFARCRAGCFFGHGHSFPIRGFCAARLSVCRREMPLASYLRVTYHARKPWQTFLPSV